MKLNIMGAEYELIVRPTVGHGRCYGEAHYSDHRIEIATEDSSPQRQAAAVVHEVVHSILNECGHNEHKEAHVVALGNGILSFLRTNPKIVPVLLGEKTLTEATGGCQ